MFDIDIALQTLVVLAFFLAVLFLYLLGYTFWNRQKKKYWQRYEDKFEDYFFPLLLEYTETEEDERDPDALIKKISKRTQDYSFFIDLLDRLTNLVEGKHRSRLNELIKHPVFLSFYTDKLFQASKNHKILACIYFQNTGNIDDRTLAKLISLSKSQNLKLAYAATKALQSADNFTVRKSALLRFFKRKDISELMVAELLHHFDPGNIEDRPQVVKAFKRILLSNIGLEFKHLVVNYMGNQNFFTSSDFLFQYLKRTQYHIKKAPLIRALIIALSQLYNEESASIIKNYISRKDVDTETHLAAVKALSSFDGEENLAFLARQLHKVSFPTRKTIICELALKDEERIKYLGQFIIANLQFIKQFQDQDHPPQQLKNFVKKIEDITRGIKIVLTHRLTNTHA